MSKTKKRLLTALITLAIVALICVFGYYELFVNTDTLNVSVSYRVTKEASEYIISSADAQIGSDGLLYVTGGEYYEALGGEGYAYEEIKSLPEAKATTLTAYLAGEDRYVKLADVSQPTGFKATKDIPDKDGDLLTKQFDFAINSRTYTDVNLSVYALNIDEQGLLALGYEPETVSYPQDGSAKAASKAKTNYEGYVKREAGKTLCLIESPYEQAYICVELNYPKDYPEDQVQLNLYETAAKITPGKQLHPIVAEFKLNFIDDSRWEYLLNGLETTLFITLLSGLMGTVLGAIVAIIRSTWEKNHENMRPGLGKALLKVTDKLCGVYLTVIRGTPVMVQLLIMYLIIFASASNGFTSAVIAFGINSGAYVAEIVRGGIMSIDNGQFEAGSSLGFNYAQTMIFIIMPQTFKNILPSLANEFIALLKETSVSGYVAVKDLNKGGDIIRSVTYSPFMPLIAVALIYLAVVMFFTKLVSLLERRLRSSEHK